MTLIPFRSSARSHGTVAGVRIVSPGHAGSTIVDLSGLDIGESLTIGRAERRDVTIYDDSVSRMHCRIKRQPDGQLVVIDEGSSNGVRLAKLGPGDARKRVTSTELRLGSYVYIGDTALVAIDEHARVPIIARRLTEFIRNAGGVYGPGSVLRRMAGFGQSIMTRLGSYAPLRRQRHVR
jgi:pSer/pThr/pTyr-binding forkhead associated (FHA) protein